MVRLLLSLLTTMTMPLDQDQRQACGHGHSTMTLNARNRHKVSLENMYVVCELGFKRPTMSTQHVIMQQATKSREDLQAHTSAQKKGPESLANKRKMNKLHQRSGISCRHAKKCQPSDSAGLWLQEHGFVPKVQQGQRSESTALSHC